MISKIAKDNGFKVEGRVQREVRLKSWLRPYDGGPVQYMDLSPLFTDEEIKKAHFEYSAYCIMVDAKAKGLVFWISDNLGNAFYLQGSDGNNGATTGAALLRLAEWSKTMKLYAFRVWDNTLYFYAKPGWEVEAFSTTDAKEYIEDAKDRIRRNAD